MKDKHELSVQLRFLVKLVKKMMKLLYIKAASLNISIVLGCVFQIFANERKDIQVTADFQMSRKLFKLCQSPLMFL